MICAVIYEDNTRGCRVINRSIALMFAENMEKVDGITLIARLKDSKLKCTGCDINPIDDQKYLCEECLIKSGKITEEEEGQHE